MRRVVVTEFGGPEQLRVESTRDALHPAQGEILVDVEAAGVNFIDVYQRSGLGAHKAPLPFRPGLEGVGRVREVGESGTDATNAFSIGQRIAWIDVVGSYADQLTVPAARAIPVPESFSLNQGLLFQALTAQYLATEYRNIRPGDRVLVHAAAGGVGHLLVQWFKHLGAWVVGTTSSDVKAESVRLLGADAVINYGPDYDFLGAVRELTEGRGVDLAIDSIGARSLVSSHKALARGGTVVSCGTSSGMPPAINPVEMIASCTRVAGGSVFSYTADPAELRRRAAEVVAGIEAGWLRLGESTSFALDHCSDAHRAIEGRGTKGKLYLVP